MKKVGVKKSGLRGKPMSLAMPTGNAEANRVVGLASIDLAGESADAKKLDEALLQYANRELSISRFQYINAMGQMATRGTAVLGTGTYGVVYRMRLKTDRTALAVKTLKKTSFHMTEEVRKACKTQEELEAARRRIAKNRSRLLIEIAVLQELTLETQGRHPNLITYHTMFFDAENVYIVMDAFAGTELFQYLTHTWGESGGRLPVLPLREVLIISCMLLETLQFIHGLGIIHRDLKLENIMVLPDKTKGSKKFQLKLIDFGQAKYTRVKIKPRVLDQTVSPGPGSTTPKSVSPLSSPAITVTPGCGSMIYLPIEALSKIVEKEEWLCTPRYATKLDIYACGMIIYILLRGPPRAIQDLARPVENETEAQEKVRQEKLLREVQSNHLVEELSKVEDAEKALATLAARMLAINPADRPTTEECLSTLREMAPFLVNIRDTVRPIAVLAVAASLACNVVYGACSSAPPTEALPPPPAVETPAAAAASDDAAPPATAVEAPPAKPATPPAPAPATSPQPPTKLTLPFPLKTRQKPATAPSASVQVASGLIMQPTVLAMSQPVPPQMPFGLSQQAQQPPVQAAGQPFAQTGGGGMWQQQQQQQQHQAPVVPVAAPAQPQQQQQQAPVSMVQGGMPTTFAQPHAGYSSVPQYAGAPQQPPPPPPPQQPPQPYSGAPLQQQQIYPISMPGGPGVMPVYQPPPPQQQPAQPAYGYMQQPQVAAQAPQAPRPTQHNPYAPAEGFSATWIACVRDHDEESIRQSDGM